MNRAVDLSEGTAFVVTDLHGEWEPYARYRDHFLELREMGQADTLIFLGDVIHGYGPEEYDYSLPIVLDIIRLQRELGPQTVIMLLGNHEFPHIYHIPLSKGDMVFTPRFEQDMGRHREEVIDFFKGLPFIVRTPGGVMMTHAGPGATTATGKAAEMLLDFNHDKLLREADRLLNQSDVQDLLQRTFGSRAGDYEENVRSLLAVNGPDDPRYYDLLRGIIVSNLEPEWSILWDFFFSQCEEGHPRNIYHNIVSHFLRLFSRTGNIQTVVVTGHIRVLGGYEVVADWHLRLASWAHATPNEAGSFLLFPVTEHFQEAEELIPYIHPIPG